MFAKNKTRKLEKDVQEERIESLFRIGARRFARDKVSMFVLIALILICVVAFAAPLVGVDYESIESRRVVDGITYRPPYSPSAVNPFGTDQLGRDLLSRVLYGLCVSLTVGILARGGSMLLGTAIGVTAGYFGGWVETILMRLTDIMLAFPALLMAMAITFVLQPSMSTVCAAIIVVGWPDIARLMRSQTLVLKNKEYVKAARALGLSRWKIIFRHIIPNSLSLLLVNFSLGIPGAIMYESGLSFFGYGVQPPMPSLGSIISDGRSYISLAPWYIIAPGLVLVLVVVCFNMLGDGLVDAFDPHAERRG